MYDFSIFEYCSITPSMELIFLGMKMNYFTDEVAKDYISWKLENSLPIDETDISVYDSSDTSSAIFILTDTGIIISDKTKRTLRYIILKSLKKDGMELLREIETVYADFDYPDDMTPFIYYMPNSATEKDAKRLNHVQLLIDKFQEFLASEEKLL